MNALSTVLLLFTVFISKDKALWSGSHFLNENEFYTLPFFPSYLLMSLFVVRSLFHFLFLALENRYMDNHELADTYEIKRVWIC